MCVLCSVIILEIDGLDTTEFTNKRIVLSGYNLFVDDIQSMLTDDTTVEQCTDLINKLSELSADKKVWIACDIAQITNKTLTSRYVPRYVL